MHIKIYGGNRTNRNQNSNNKYLVSHDLDPLPHTPDDRRREKEKPQHLLNHAQLEPDCRVKRRLPSSQIDDWNDVSQLQKWDLTDKKKVFKLRSTLPHMHSYVWVYAYMYIYIFARPLCNWMCRAYKTKHYEWQKYIHSFFIYIYHTLCGQWILMYFER